MARQKEVDEPDVDMEQGISDLKQMWVFCIVYLTIYALVSQLFWKYCNIFIISTGELCSIFVSKNILYVYLKFSSEISEVIKPHTARAPNLRPDLITAKVSCGIPEQTDWSIMCQISNEVRNDELIRRT